MKKSLILILCIGFCFNFPIKPGYSITVPTGVQQKVLKSNKKKKKWEKRIKRLMKKAARRGINRRTVHIILSVLIVISIGIGVGIVTNISPSLGCRPLLQGLVKASIFGFITLGLAFLKEII